MENLKPDISLFFPVYNDERTVQLMVEKSEKVLRELANHFEVIIVNDGSADRSGEIANELSRTKDFVKVFHHETNLGYGAAIKNGLSHCQYEWICFTDGDDEYDVFDLYKLIRHKDYYDLIITFRYLKIYSTFRIFVSWVYNKILRWLFRMHFRDVSTGLRLIRKSLVDDLELISNSPFIGAEITIKTMLKGYRIGEVGIQTFPREFGRGTSVSGKNIWLTILDMRRIYHTIFSKDYELPVNRTRTNNKFGKDLPQKQE